MGLNTMKTGNGKIANLPPEIRDQLNYRITEGDSGSELVEWLNSQPEVVKVITERFDGAPISEQNLSEWRKRGYQKWLAYHNIVDESNAVSGNTAGIAATGIDCDKLIVTLTGAYAEAIQRWIITPCDQMNHKLAVYKNITNGVIAMRRAELLKVRLEIDQERLAILREKRGKKSQSSSGSSGDTTSSPESAPNPRQSDSEYRHSSFEPFRQAQGPELAEGLRHSSAPDAPDPAPSPTPEPPPKLAESPANTESFPLPAVAATAPQSAESQDMGNSRAVNALAAGQEVGELAAPTPSVPIPVAEPSAPSNVTPSEAPVAAPSIQPTAPVPAAAAPTQPSRPASAAPPKPVSPQDALLWPTRRPGGPPRNASPRNPLGLL